jgi:hypothetical protein
MVGDRERRQINEAQRSEIDLHHAIARRWIKAGKHRRVSDRAKGRRRQRHTSNKPDCLTGCSLPGHRLGRRAGIHPAEGKRFPQFEAPAVHNDLASLAVSCQPHGLARAFEGGKGLATRARVGVVSRWRDMEHGFGRRGTCQRGQQGEARKVGVHGALIMQGA